MIVMTGFDWLRINTVSKHTIAEDVSRGSTHTVLKKHLHLRPHKIALEPGDSHKRSPYCRWFRDVTTANGEGTLLVTPFTAETCFQLPGYANNQYSRVWLANNPHESKDTPLHDQKAGVWCVISRTRIIGLLFFNDAISWERYYEVVLYPFMGHLNEDEIAQRILPTGWCYATHSSCFPAATARCARGQDNFKKLLTTTVTQLHTS
jgi:hypothetical protein